MGELARGLLAAEGVTKIKQGSSTELPCCVVYHLLPWIIHEMSEMGMSKTMMIGAKTREIILPSTERCNCCIQLFVQLRQR